MNAPAVIGIMAPVRTESCELVIAQLHEACQSAGIYCYEVGCHMEDDLALGPPDILLCLGGDGTMLSAAASAATRGIILGGVNTGHLGF